MSELYDQVVSNQKQDDRQFKLGIANEQQFDADRATRIFSVSAKTKLPDEVVDADLDNLEGMLKRDEFNADDYRDEVNGAPVFNSFAAENPYHLSVLERDHKNLTRLERTLKPLFQSWDAGWAMSEIAEIRTRNMAGDTRPEDAENLKGLRDLTAGGHFGVENKFAKVFTGFAKQLPVQAWLLNESKEEAMIGGITFGAIGLTGGAGFGAVPGFFTGIGAGFFAGRTEAAYRLERGLAFDDFTELGLDEKTSKQVATGVGVVNASLESIGLGALTKRLPGFRQVQRDATGEVVSRVFSSPTFKSAVARATAHYGEGMATEIVTEVLQEATLMAGREHLKAAARESGDDRPELDPMKSEEFWNTVEQTAIETMYGTALIAGMGPASQLYRESRQAYQAERLQQVFRAMGEAAKDTNLRESAPSKYKEFVDRLTQSGEVKDLQIDAKEFDTYFQDQGIDPDEVMESLGLDKQDIAEARSLGGSIDVPVGAYLRDIAATEHHNGLMPHLKTEGNISMSEAKLLEKNNPELLKELESLVSGDENVDNSVEQGILDDVTGQLVSAGHEATTAGSLAQIMLGIPNIARRAGVDPQALYDRVFGGVVPAKSEALEKRDVDVRMDPLLNRLRKEDFPNAKKVRGVTLLDFLKGQGGVLDQGGELSARDAQLEFPGLVTKEGMELDKAAELAAEAGYIAEHDVSLLQDAIDRELSGEQVVGLGADPEAVETNRLLEELDELLGMAGIDVKALSNAEVRAELNALETHFQDSDKDSQIAEVSEILVSQIAEVQDFSAVTFKDKFKTPEGKPITVTQNGQKAYDTALKKRNVLKRLLECLNG